eukprot:802295_1
MTETQTHTNTHTQTATHTSGSDEDEVDPQVWKDLNAGVRPASPTVGNRASGESATNDHMVDHTISPDTDLTNFIHFYSKLIKTSELIDPLNRNSKKKAKKLYCDQMKATATHIMKWENGSSVPDKSHMPAETTGEKDAVQPILHALLYKLSTLEPRSSSSSESSNDTRRNYKLRSDIHTERFTKTNITDNEGSNNAGKRKRVLDDEVGSLRPVHGVLPPHLVRTGIEVKSIARNNKNAAQLHQEARNQIIGLCAKKLLVAFDFGNTGINASTTGVIVSPVYVQFIRVSINGMGTKEAKVVLEESPMAPLVDLEAFSHLVRKQENRNYLQLRCRCLFPTPTKSSDEDPNSLPKGILQLHHMLHSKDPTFLDEMYFKENDDSGNKSDLQYLVAEPKASEEQLEQAPDKKEVGPLIGSGGFGMAFEARWNDDYVVKASHFGEMKSIKQEIKALHRLTHGN